MDAILATFKELDKKRGEEIEQWFVEQRGIAEPFFSTSVDLRHSGLRLVPVDTNLYPAGFNNLSPAARGRAVRMITRYLDGEFAHVKRVVIVPENHTRNLGYLDNLATMKSLIESAGREVKIASLVAEPGQPVELETLSRGHITEYPLVREGNHVRLEGGFEPELIIMNNDMTSGVPPILENLEQPIVPPLEMGWYRRRKSVHFRQYEKLAEEFGKTFSIDPWLICAKLYRCGIVDFKEQTGLESLAKGVEKVLEQARAKHKEYGIAEEPYVYVKAESGTYGMGIMTVRSPDEIFELNKKLRNKMNVIKEGAVVQEVIIQEGVPTIDRVDEKPAEPMVYMIDGIPVGGMYRINGTRNGENNLNAAGMEFTGMCDEAEVESPQWRKVKDCNFRSFGIIAAMAALAAAREDYDSGRDGEGI